MDNILYLMELPGGKMLCVYANIIPLKTKMLSDIVTMMPPVGH